jgi:hypothetical protein
MATVFADSSLINIAFMYIVVIYTIKEIFTRTQPAKLIRMENLILQDNKMVGIKFGVRHPPYLFHQAIYIGDSIQFSRLVVRSAQ